MIAYHLMVLFSIGFFGGTREPGIRQGVDLYFTCYFNKYALWKITKQEEHCREIQ